MRDKNNNPDDILSQLLSFRSKPNGGIIQIVLRDGSTIIGMYKNVEFSPETNDGNIELTNGTKISYRDIERII
jgi:hypothetical protein